MAMMRYAISCTLYKIQQKDIEHEERDNINAKARICKSQTMVRSKLMWN